MSADTAPAAMPGEERFDVGTYDAATEAIARALALHAGGKITGPSRHAAADEFGWDANGFYREQYVEKHWREHRSAAGFAYGAAKALFAPILAEKERLVWENGRLAVEADRNEVGWNVAEARALAAEAALAAERESGARSLRKPPLTV